MRGNLVAPGRFDCGHHPQATLSSPHRRVSQEKPPQVLPSSMKAPQSAMLFVAEGAPTPSEGQQVPGGL